MKLFHDSRNDSYRAPYGAVTPETPVTLALDVWDAPGASVTLRTWTDDEGERLHEMKPQAKDSAGASDATEGSASNEPQPKTPEAPVRYSVEFTPHDVGIVWYHFIVTDENGNTQRFGTADGRVGGAGRQHDWEPPSFQLSVYPADEAPQPWFKPIDGFLHNPNADHSIAEMLETLRENYPTCLFERAMPWGDADADIASKVEAALAAHQTASGLDQRLFSCGSYACQHLADDVAGIWRSDEMGNLICVVLNFSPHEAKDVLVPMVAEAVSELVGGYAVPLTRIPAANGEEALYASVHVWQVGFALLHFHAKHRMERPLEPGMGVLAHVTSLPMDGPQFLDENQRIIKQMDEMTAESQKDERFAHCVEAVEAVLEGAGITADDVVARAERQMNRNVRHPRDRRPGTMGAPAREFVDWLAQTNVRYWQVLPVNPTDDFGSPYAGISAFAGNIRLLEGDPISIIHSLAAFNPTEQYKQFCEREKDWLDPYVSFMAIRQKLQTDAPWQEWPQDLRHYDPELVKNDPELRFYARAFRRAQFVFDQQWSDLHSYANERGVSIIGDMPIYVSPDSADVWAHPELFQLGPDGYPSVVAGCPPDAFAADGQIWGNPVYDWGALKQSGYAWWLRRLERAFKLYDTVRLDHFIGFARYYSIPAGQSASHGSFERGPGIDFFRSAYRKFGELPLIAEDLGTITPTVRALSAACGFLGMDIVQFVDGNDPLGGYQPRPEKIAYTGTHDNQTLLGYCRGRYQGYDTSRAAEQILQHVLTCNADVCIIPLQDVLGLGDDARMNVPGVAEGNWTWQAEGYDVEQSLDHLRELVNLHANR